MDAAVRPGKVEEAAARADALYERSFKYQTNAALSYREFGAKLLALRNGLRVLSDIVRHARDEAHKLAAQLGRCGHAIDPHFTARYDAESALEITGDYSATLGEIETLVEENQNMLLVTGTPGPVDWYMLHSTRARDLETRLELHILKVEVLKAPLEIDLLSRIHLELAKQAPHFHHDVAATNGIVVRGSQVYNVLLAAQIAQNGDEPYQGERHPRNPPVLQLHTLRQRLQPLDPDDYALELYGLLRPPDELINGFVEAAGMQHRAFEQNGIPLPLLADAFVRHFRSSTAHARDGASPYSTPVPPHAQYVGLVKCAWLMENILRGTDFTNRTRDPNSHWPSYVRQLLENLRARCRTYAVDTPIPSGFRITPDLCGIWPDQPSPRKPIHLHDVFLEELLEIPIKDQAHSSVNRLKLERHVGSGKGGVTRFRVTLVNVQDRKSGTASREVVDAMDFDITEVVVNAGYALPNGGDRRPFAIITARQKTCAVTFYKLKDAFKFQHSITGYRVVDYWTAYEVKATFVVPRGAPDTVVADASVQVWFPRVMDGSLNKSDASEKRRRSTVASGVGQMMFGAVNPSAVTGGISELPTEQERAELDTNPPGYDAAIPRVFEPDGQNDGAPPVSPIGSPDGPSAQGSAVKRRRSALGFLSALKGGSSKSVRSSAAPLPESSGRHGSTVSLQGVKRRDSESSSGGKGKTTVGARSTITRPVDAGDGTKGLIHERPLKPMLVLFCQLRQSGVQGVATPSTGGIPSTGLFIATVDIDGSVVTNPRLCGCALAGDQCPCGILNRGEWSPGGKGPGNGGSSGGGGRSLSVRMYRGLDVALTALGRQGTTSTDALGGLAALTIGVGNGNSGQPLRGVERVTLEFPSPSTRRDCVGLARPCACKDLDIEINLWECVDKQRHEGLVGKVRNMYRRQMREWERVEEGRKDVLDDLEEYEMA